MPAGPLSHFSLALAPLSYIQASVSLSPSIPIPLSSVSQASQGRRDLGDPAPVSDPFQSSRTLGWRFLSFLASSWKEKLRGDLALSHLLRTRILGISRGERKMRRNQQRPDQHRLALQTIVFSISHKENQIGSNLPSLTPGNILGGLYAFLIASSF